MRFTLAIAALLGFVTAKKQAHQSSHEEPIENTPLTQFIYGAKGVWVGFNKGLYKKNPHNDECLSDDTLEAVLNFNAKEKNMMQEMGFALDLVQDVRACNFKQPFEDIHDHCYGSNKDDRRRKLASPKIDIDDDLDEKEPDDCTVGGAM